MVISRLTIFLKPFNSIVMLKHVYIDYPSANQYIIYGKIDGW